MVASLLDAGAREWKDALERIRHDIYHVPAYVVLDARLCGGVPAAFHYEEAGGRLLLPLILRDIPGSGLRDAVSPYGYPAPVSDTADPAFWERACAAMRETLRGAGIVTAFVDLPMLLAAPLPVEDTARAYLDAVAYTGQIIAPRARPA